MSDSAKPEADAAVESATERSQSGSMLSALAALSAIGVLLAGFEERGETNPFPGCILISGLTAYALLWLLVFALGGYS